MRYLKLVNSFDEFAEQAAPNTVFYHIDNDVYYWLNLKSIWGYIGYDSGNNKFVTNGRQFSIIPSVPDPQSLSTAATINNNSFPINYRPNTLTIKSSEFDIMPIAAFYGPGSSESTRIRYFVESGIPIPSTITFDGAYVDLVLENADLSGIKRITYNNSHGQYRLIINDDNTRVSSNCLIFGSNIQPYKGHNWFKWRVEKDIDILTEDDIFFDVPDVLGNTNDPYRSWYNQSSSHSSLDTYPHVVDCSNYNKLKITLHSLYELSVPAYYPVGVNNLVDIIIDAEKSNGKIDDNLYTKWLGGSSKKFGSIEYQNVSDYGTYYKPYQSTESAELVPLDILELAKTKYIEMFSGNIVRGVKTWANVSAQSVDLSGVKHFVYYIDGYPSAWTSQSELVNFVDYSQFSQNGTAYYRFGAGSYSNNIVVTSTPKFSNVNLESYGGFSTNSNCYVYFNTSDNSINLGILRVIGSAARIYLADKDIYISGIIRNGAAGGEILLLKYENIGSGVLHLRGFANNPNVTIPISAYYDTTNLPIYEMIDVSMLVDSDNPNALDYYNTGVSMSVSSWMFRFTNGYITRNKLDAYSFGYFVGSSSKLKCIAGGGEFYNNTTLLTTAEDMENLFNAIPNRSVSNLTLSFNPSQFDLLTQEQIEYANGLGYAVVKHTS